MTAPLPVPASPQIPIPVPIVGQPVSPVVFFRRMPGGGTCYVKPTDHWRDNGDSLWAEHAVAGEDCLVVVEHNGRPVPPGDPIPRSTVARQWGPLTREPAARTTEETLR